MQPSIGTRQHLGDLLALRPCSRPVAIFAQSVHQPLLSTVVPCISPLSPFMPPAQAAAVVAIPMDHELKTHLEEHQVEQSIMDHLASKRCTNMRLFVNWVEKSDDCAKFLEGHDTLAEDIVSLAYMRHAWRVAHARAERGLKRCAEGLPDEGPDEPLRPEIHTNIMKAFLTTYGLRNISPHRVVSDSLLGRIRREFESFKPTLLNVSKVKTLADARSSTTKHQRLSDTLTITLGSNQEEGSARTLLQWMEKLRILTTSWAIAGNYDVPILDGVSSIDVVDRNGQKMTRMVHLSEADEYCYEFIDQIHQLADTYTEPSILSFVDAVEPRFRAKTVELTRGPLQLPFGYGLINSLRTYGSAWQAEHQRLVEKSRGRQPALTDTHPNPPPPPRAPNRQSQPNNSGGKGQGKDKDKGKRRMVTAHSLANGGQICQRWNSTGGCRDKDCKKGHVCDAVLASTGKACGASHRRSQHVAQTNGEVKYQ